MKISQMNSYKSRKRGVVLVLLPPLWSPSLFGIDESILVFKYNLFVNIQNWPRWVGPNPSLGYTNEQGLQCEILTLVFQNKSYKWFLRASYLFCGWCFIGFLFCLIEKEVEGWLTCFLEFSKEGFWILWSNSFLKIKLVQSNVFLFRIIHSDEMRLD